MSDFELLLKLPGDPDSPSPFEPALGQLARGGSLDLVCPYLSVGLLERLLALGTAVRLVTDAEEWMRAYARPARQTILRFITQHADRVRHYRDVHAKVALSAAGAMVGSANFTESGFEKRQEAGVLVRDIASLKTLSRWYDALWSDAVPIDLQSLAQYARELGERAAAEQGRPKRRLPPPRQRVTPPEMPSKGHVGDADVQSSDQERRLIRRLETAQSRRWAEQYFDAMGRLFSALNVSPDDPCVVTAIPKSRANLTVTFNTRGVLYRLWGWYDGVPESGAQIIVSDYRLGERGALRHVHLGAWRYSAQSGEKTEVPWVVGFSDFSFLDDAAIMEDWIATSGRELARRDRAPKHRLHCPVVVRAAVDPSYRQHIFAQVGWAND